MNETQPDLTAIQGFLNDINRKIAEEEERTHAKLTRLQNEIRQLQSDDYQLRQDHAARIEPMRQQRDAIIHQIARVRAATMPEQIIVIQAKPE